MARDHSSRSDEAGVGPDPRLSRHLMPLREAKRYRLTKGEPDIRGWAVYASNGREVGRVGDLLVDPSIGEVVMFDVNRAATGDQTVAPLRAAWIDRDNKRVILDSAHLAPSDELPSLGRTPALPTSLEEEIPLERQRADLPGPHDAIERELDRERGIADSSPPDHHPPPPTDDRPGRHS
jgi:sporulation protein YlmC with PRC-barrel domain